MDKKPIELNINPKQKKGTHVKDVDIQNGNSYLLIDNNRPIKPNIKGLYRFCPWIAHSKTVSQISPSNGTLFKIKV